MKTNKTHINNGKVNWLCCLPLLAILLVTSGCSSFESLVADAQLTPGNKETSAFSIDKVLFLHLGQINEWQPASQELRQEGATMLVVIGWKPNGYVSGFKISGSS